MPTYQYVCTECGEPLEVVQSFSDDALTVCPSCDGRLRKVYSAVGIVFKGSGFYRTDSAKSSDSSVLAGSSKGGSNGSASSDSGDSAAPAAKDSSSDSAKSGSASSESSSSGASSKSADSGSGAPVAAKA
ncbi:FmdB family zinc ribbon protein [Nocardiopsis potens]|uniref:FmdB family zinc ribbon protein n=1 Tax=Nocardiopsis potens TaxID=1246458 RepID=UPI000345C8E2|nr:FmdB family zinc ribbon protein [Nocardiopsis potens]